MVKIKILSIIFLFSILLASMASASFAQTKPGPKPPLKAPAGPEIPSTAVTVPDDPVIREFTGPTYPVVNGSEITLRWGVVPGTGGSPITDVTIVAPYLPDAPMLPIGERRVLFLGGDFPEERRYRLTATNRAGRSTSRTLTVQHILIREALDQLEIFLRTNPQEFRAGRPVDLEIGFSNREGAPLAGMNMIVTQGGRTVGSLRDVRIEHGTASATFRLPDTGFTGAVGDYTVDVEYRGVHRLKRFRTVLAPYFTIAPTP